MAQVSSSAQVGPRRAWDAIASRFDEYVTPFNMALADQALDRVGLRAGERLLDVAAGSGALAISAARRGAWVLATDISPIMVERLDARAREEGLANLETRVMDGHALQIEDAPFDVTASQHGVSLFPDIDRGLRELARVTRPAGRVLIVAFGPLREVEFISFFLRAVRQANPGIGGPSPDNPPLPFQVADPDALHRKLVEAGLTDVRVESTSFDAEFHSVSHMWDLVTSSNPIAGMLVGALTHAQRATAREHLDGMLRERAGGSGPALLTNAVNIGIGRR